MSRDIPEADWKVLRCVHPIALERFCERVLGEIAAVGGDGARSPHQRYLDIFKLVQQRDGEMARIFDDPKRSRAIAMLAAMRRSGLLTDVEFSGLSRGTRAIVESILDPGITRAVEGKRG